MKLSHINEARHATQRTLGNLFRFFEPGEFPGSLMRELQADYCASDDMEFYMLNDQYIASFGEGRIKKNKRNIEWLVTMHGCSLTNEQRKAGHDLIDQVVIGSWTTGPLGLSRTWIPSQQELDQFIKEVQVFIKPKEPKRVF